MAIQHRGIASTDLAGVVQDNDLGNKGSQVKSGVILNTDMSYNAKELMTFALIKYNPKHNSMSLDSLS